MIRKTTLVAAAALLTTATALAPPATAADNTLKYSDQCQFPNGLYPGRPWSLQRVQLDELWSQSKGKGVRVAVIDTGVDVKNPQLTAAVDAKAGRNYLPKGLKDDNGDPVERGKENGTTDTVGHGTKVAGIIAARPIGGTGFVGLAPEATIIPIQQNDAEGHGTTETLATAIRYAIDAKADVINISQDTSNAVRPTSDLEQVIDTALDAGIVVVADDPAEPCQGAEDESGVHGTLDGPVRVGQGLRGAVRRAVRGHAHSLSGGGRLAHPYRYSDDVLRPGTRPRAQASCSDRVLRPPHEALAGTARPPCGWSPAGGTPG